MKFRITNDDEVFESTLKEGDFLEVHLDGFGECEALEDDGSLVAIEIKDGVPTVYVFSDINHAGPTHSIRCFNAQETKRRKECET